VAGSLSGVIFKKRGADLDMTVFKGKTLSFDLVLSIGGKVEDMAGWKVWLLAFSNGGAKTLDLSTENGKATILPEGRVRFSATPEETDFACYGTWRVDVETAEGDSHKLVSGRVGID
jgi:hypothetical protein